MKRIVRISILILAVSFVLSIHSDAANYIDEDEIYRILYGKTKEEIEQENALAEQQYYDELKERERQEDQDKYIQIVNSKEDFQEAICYQMMEHQEEIYYDTDDITLYNKINDILDETYLYYCKDAPLMSGFYLGFYLQDGITCLYKRKYNTEDGRYRIGIQLKFKYSKEEFDRHMKDMSELASKLKCDNDYDSVKAVHDYLIENIDYDNEYKNYDDLSGMKEGVMVCNGYTMATFNLLSNMGIPVRMISGRCVDQDGNVGGHAWNIVCVDGQWYNMDVTWDDEGENGVDYQYFLKGSNDFTNHIPREEYKKVAESVSATSYNIQNEAEDGTESSNQGIDDSEELTFWRKNKMLYAIGIYLVVFILVYIVRLKKIMDNQ